MDSKYSVSLAKIIKDQSLEVLYLPQEATNLYVTSCDVNRPGLILSGYETYFDPERVQFLGLSEIEYLRGLDDAVREQRVKTFIGKQPPVIIVTRGLECPAEVLKSANEFKVPVVRTTDATSDFMSTLISYLNVELAPRVTRHGVLVEVSGEGVLILGDSGVGKSETAVELIKRGHRLIADDAVEIRRVSSKTLVGSAPDNIRHFIELRGIGIINARHIFGMGAVKMTEKIDMVVQLEPWDSNKVYDRMGIDNEYVSILGVEVPVTVVPVKPGRNLAVILEVAAMNNRQKKMGYNAARELLNKLGMNEEEPGKEELEVWQNV